MALNDTDKFLVNDGTKTETVTFAQYKEGNVLNDTDKFLVNDGTKTETVTWATLKSEGGGAIDAPVLDSVALAQDAPIDSNRYTGKSFTTTAEGSGGQAETLEMTAKVEGALDLKAGTEPISTNLYPGTNSTNVLLLLEGNSNLGDVIDVGDTVTASSSYTPRTSKIEDFFYKPLALSAGTSGTVDFSGLDDDDNIFFFVIENGGNGANGVSAADSSTPNRGGAGGGRGGSYYRQMTKAEYVAEFGSTTYTQALSNNFGGITLLAGNATGGSGGTSGSAGTNGDTFSTDFTAINSFYPGELVFAAGNRGSSGSFNGDGALGNSQPAPGGGGDAGILITTTLGSLPNLQQATKGDNADFVYTDANGGNPGTGYGAGGGGGAAAPQNQSRNGGQFGSGINIVVTGVSENATLTLEDSTDIHLFQTGDEVQPGVSVVSTDVALRKIVVDGGDWAATDSSQVWSRDLDAGTPFNGAVENVFDGNVDTFVQGEINRTVLWQPVPGIQSGAEGVEIKFDTGSGQGVGSVANIFINGAEAYSGAVPSDSYAFKVPGSENKEITSLSIAGGNGEAVRLYSVKVAGRLLVDAVNDSQVWSNGVFRDPTDSATYDPAAGTANTGFDTGTPAVVFDGDTDTRIIVARADPAVSWLYIKNLGLTEVTSLRLFMRASADVKVDGVSVTTTPGLLADAWQWKSVDSPPSSIDLIAMQGNGLAGGGGAKNAALGAIEVNGKILVDTGIDPGPGDSTVKTLTPKKGSGTIFGIAGDQVTITPFTDNCFKEGQWLTVDKMFEVTPLSDPIQAYDPDTKTITLTGPKDLPLFRAGDEVTMSTPSGETPTTSTIQSIQGDYRTMSSTTYEGTDNRDTLFSDAAGLWDPDTLQVWNGTVAVYFDENYVSWSQKAMNAACEIHLYNLDGVMTCGWITGNPAGPYTYTTVITSSTEPVVKMAVAPEKSQNIVGFWFSGNGTMQKICGWDLLNLQTITDTSWKLSAQYTLQFADGTGLDMFQVGAVLQDDPSVVYGAKDDDKWGGSLIHFENNGRYWIVSPLNNFPNSSWNSGNKADWWEGDPIMEWTNDPTYLHAIRQAVQARRGANSDIDGWRVCNRDIGAKIVTFYYNNGGSSWGTGTDADYNEPTAQPTRKWRALWDNGSVKWGNINKINSTPYSPYRRMYETDYKSTVVSVDLETNTVVVNGGQWDGYEGQTIEVPGLDATGTVSAIDVAAQTITLSVSNDLWVADFVVKGPTKTIGQTTAYLDFDASGAVTGYRATPVPPRAMTETTMSTLTFPDTFSATGTSPDDEFLDPNAYIQTSAQLKNLTGDSEIVKSNVVVPETTTVRIAAGESSHNTEELKAMWTQLATHDQRVADHTARKRQETIDDFDASIKRFIDFASGSSKRKRKGKKS